MRASDLLVLFLAIAFVVSIKAGTNMTELHERSAFAPNALQFDYPESSILSASAAGTTYTMDLTTNPILATLPGPGLSGKIDDFAPCSIKVPHVHPRGSKFSYVVAGTLEVGIAEEDTGRILDFNVTTGSAIVVPQGLLHYMKNNNCTENLKMLTVFNNADAGELTMLDKILGFPTSTVLASTGLDSDVLKTFRNGLPKGQGDLRVDPTCQARCGIAGTPYSSPAATQTAG